MITNDQSGTRIDEIGPRIYRISTPLDIVTGGFTFNQYLIDDDEPLLFHTGPRKMFPLVQQAIASVMAVERLRHLAFSHVEADECGALNALLAVAPRAAPVCSRIAASVSMQDLADRPPRALADGEELRLGSRVVRWLDTPHLPHGWECGYLFESTTKTLFCGDLFTQAGARPKPLTSEDILGPSEMMRKALDYHSHSRNTRAHIERLAATNPTTLACMHGSAWQGDGASLLRALGDALDA